MKILNFGSLNIDYVYSVDHFVKPGETVSSYKRELFCGGKGLNQSVAFARAGADVYHAGNVGTDGKMLIEMLENVGADSRFIQTWDMPSGHAVIQVDKKGENCIILFDGANSCVDTKQIDSVLDFFEKGDAVILQNEINDIPLIIDKAKKKGLITVLNPSPFNEKLDSVNFENLDWLIINETEGKEISGQNAPEKILDNILSRYPDIKIVLTLGKDGSVYADKNERISQSIVDAKVVDTTGAGDTFTGYFFTSVFSSKTVKDALFIASKASAIAVSRKGAAPSIPTMSEVVK